MVGVLAEYEADIVQRQSDFRALLLKMRREG